jgi:hypothetical protein
MGLGNGNPKYGNKGSNYAYELGVLKLLKQIVVASGGAPTPATRAASLSREIVAGIQTTGSTYSISFFNASAATESLVAGARLKPGESVSFSSDESNLVGPISFDPDPDTAGSADLVISIVQ